MIKKVFTKVLLSSLLLGSSLIAETSYIKDDSFSLIGLEYGSSNHDVTSDGSPAYSETLSPQSGAFKIGAQTENYRLFLSARYYDADGIDSMMTMGAELQYMINFSSFMNFYMGVNTGTADIEITDASSTRKISEKYIGGDVGFNIHVGEKVDLELGARSMGLEGKHTSSGVTYTFDNITTGYMSLIFKYQMD